MRCRDAERRARTQKWMKEEGNLKIRENGIQHDERVMGINAVGWMSMESREEALNYNLTWAWKYKTTTDRWMNNERISQIFIWSETVQYMFIRRYFLNNKGRKSLKVEK